MFTNENSIVLTPSQLKSIRFLRDYFDCVTYSEEIHKFELDEILVSFEKASCILLFIMTSPNKENTYGGQFRVGRRGRITCVSSLNENSYRFSKYYFNSSEFNKLVNKSGD